MAIFIIDDGGDNTDGLTWATAYTSYVSFAAAEVEVTGDIVIFGHDHVDQNTYSANYTLQGPTTTGPMILISCTQGTGSVAGGLSTFVYQKATSLVQMDSSNAGANVYTLTAAGIWAMYGVSLRSGGNMSLTGVQQNFYVTTSETTFGAGPNGYVLLGTANAYNYHNRLTIDLTLDGSSARTGAVMGNPGSMFINGLDFINPGFRTGSLIITNSGSQNAYATFISGADFSGFTNATTPEIIDTSSSMGQFFLSHSKTAVTHILKGPNTAWRGGQFSIVNVGSGNQPTQQYLENKFGRLDMTESVTRTGGREIEGTAVSWGGATLGIETSSSCSVDVPFYTPWVSFAFTATGTFEVAMFCGNNTADFDDDEAWIEVEYKDDATSGEWTFATDKPNREIASTAQTDDTSSTWNGDTLTFMQKLHVTGLTVGTAGLGRARVGIGVASIAASRDFYIDGKVVVT
jgi:hypothetical protein